jgi:sulfhydrogenase subunit beta (sulfur reductase)
MVTNLPAIGTPFALEVAELAQLFPSLQRRGYQVVGPTVRESAIVYEILNSFDELPAGWTAEQEAGQYRLKRRDDAALFGYAVGAQGWKRFLYPAEARIFEARRDGNGFHILHDEAPPPRYAFVGMRACELAAMAIQDRVLLGERYSEAVYQSRRHGVFLVAVNCTVSAPTCFCASMHTGPPAEAGFDLALTELAGGERHLFVAEAGTRQGAEVLAELGGREADATLRLEAEKAVKAVTAGMQRRLQTNGIREMLYAAFEHPHWDEVAARCLACGNCTMVCPTCFCTTVEDVSSVDGTRAERWRKWDSCFTQNFSYIHGGSVRMSIKSRYRQWLTHKLAAWIDQFGSSGCVGCGRCITWCPAGIDITREVAALWEEPVPAAATGESRRLP